MSSLTVSRKISNNLHLLIRDFNNEVKFNFKLSILR